MPSAVCHLPSAVPHSPAMTEEYDYDAAYDPPPPTGRRDWGAAFDALGRPVEDPTSDAVRFCAHLQLVPLSPVGSAYGRIRATVRVVWQRAGGDHTRDFCTTDAVPIVSGPDSLAHFHFVHHTTVIAQQTAPRL